jgi:succinate-acetate transporter protein
MQLTVGAPAPLFGDSTPLGLLGLAIGCAALVPVAFGLLPSEPAAIGAMLQTTAWFCLVFGAGCQMLAGLMALANKNTLGGTLFTTFSFNWVMNYWVLDRMSQGKAVDPGVLFAVDVAFLLIFVVLTYAFGFFSTLLVLFLGDIDLVYVLRIARHFAPGVTALGPAIGVATVVLGGLSLYIALATLVNEASGKTTLPLGGPLLKSPA